MQQCTAVASVTGVESAPVTGRVDRHTRRALPAAALAILLLSAAVLAPRASVSRLDGPSSPPGGVVSSRSGDWARLTSLERLAISRGIGADQSTYWATATGTALTAHNGAQHLSLRFAAGGVTVATAAGRVRMSLQGVRADGRPIAAATAAPRAWANRVSYARGAVTEWYANGPLGLEQGFTVSRAAAAVTRTLTVALTLHASGGLLARAARGGLDLLSGHRLALRYDGLRAVDATGRTLPAWMTLHGSSVVLHVRSAGARGVVVIDPIMQAGTLLAADGQSGDGLGNAIAISGTTIAIGAANATVGGQSDAGAVYLFSEPAGGWTSVSSAIKLTNAAPATGVTLGTSVAISGNTVLAGAPGATVGGVQSGAVYLFNEPASGWASENETGVLTEPSANAGDEFGYAVAASGSTVVVGAPLSVYYSGSAYVYTEPSGGWASESPAATLTTSAPGLNGLGFAVAIDGSTIAAGAPLSNNLEGQVDVFAEPSGGWADGTQTALLSACDPTTVSTCPAGSPTPGQGQGIGQSVSVFGDTVIAGAQGTTVGSNAGEGAVYIFARPSSGAWANATDSAFLTEPNGAVGDAFGSAVSISGPLIFASAPTAMVGANANQGAVYDFIEPSGGWSSAAPATELTESSGNVGDQFGTAIAVAGGTLAIGADAATINSATSQGESFVFGGVPVASDSGSGSGSGGGSGSGANGGPPGSTGGGSSGSRYYATVLSVSGGAGRALVSLKCIQTVKCVAANAQLVVDEKLQGKKVVATLAKSPAKVKYTYKHVVIGANHVTLAARAHTTLSVYLNAAGLALLRSHTKMPVGLSVTSTGRTLRLATVTITRPVPAKKKAKKK